MYRTRERTLCKCSGYHTPRIRPNRTLSQSLSYKNDEPWICFHIPPRAGSHWSTWAEKRRLGNRSRPCSHTGNFLSGIPTLLWQRTENNRKGALLGIGFNVNLERGNWSWGRLEIPIWKNKRESLDLVELLSPNSLSFIHFLSWVEKITGNLGKWQKIVGRVHELKGKTYCILWHTRNVSPSCRTLWIISFPVHEMEFPLWNKRWKYQVLSREMLRYAKQQSEEY